MPFITGTLLIDAPASALNNSNAGIPGSTYRNTVDVKLMRTPQGLYPYVSAQAFRYWLRETLAKRGTWRAAPVYREGEIAYTDANPLEWWDDDLFGYMRAPASGVAARKARTNDPEYTALTPLDTNNKGDEAAVTRVSPFRTSTVVSIAPLRDSMVTEDFGVMARQGGDPVIHVHRFYRGVLQGLFSLDLHSCGTFSYANRTGYRNLDAVRCERAKAQGLEHLSDSKSYRLPMQERIQRITTLLDAMATLEGGAKQASHYTDVSPVVVLLAVTKGGNHIFGHMIGTDSQGSPSMNLGAFSEVLDVHRDEILSPIYVGWTKGFHDDERARLQASLKDEAFAKEAREKGISIQVMHPRQAFGALTKDLARPESSAWLE